MKIRSFGWLTITAFFLIAAGCNKGTESSADAKAGEKSPRSHSIMTIGGQGIEIAKDMIPSGDGGYMLAGYTTSKGAGATDAYLVKITSNGKMVWDRTFGESNNDALYSVTATRDGGYIACGKIEIGAEKNRNVYIVKTDGSGERIWDKNLGAEKEEEANCIIESHDGGYLVCGLTNSKGAGSGDAWLIKLSESGSVEWEYTFGTTSADYANSILRTKDGGYVFCGLGGPGSDMYVVTLDADGKVKWEKFIGGPNYDLASSMVGNDDGSFVVAGLTQEKPNTTAYAYIVKLAKNGDLVWERRVQTDNWSMAMNIKRADNGFITCGTIVVGKETVGKSNAYFIRLDQEGEVLWTEIVGGQDVAYGNVTIPEPGGSFVFAGYIGYVDKARAGNFDILFGRITRK